jgi:Mg-chelatase subunit ChlD
MPDTTLIAVVLDRSGSMQTLRDAAIEGFNAFLEEQRAQPGVALLFLARFDHEYEVVHDGVPLAQVRPLTRADLVPRGHTALLDALGRTLLDVEARAEAEPRPSRGVVVVITDGRENYSREFDEAQVAALVASFQGRPGWQVLFLGTDRISIEQAQTLGIDPGATLHFTGTSAGLRAAFAAIDDSLRGFRAGGPATLARNRRRMN